MTKLSCTPSTPITYSAARVEFARLGVTLRKTEYGEFRVNYRHGTESTAAYESDLPAAIETGLAMLKHRATLESSLLRMGLPADVAARDSALAAMGV